MTWNVDRSKVAVLAGDQIHLFDAESRTYASSFSIRGERGVSGAPTGLYWNDAAILVVADDGAASPVWVFRPDGEPLGPILSPDRPATPLSTRNGAVLLLDALRVGIAERGFSTLTIYDTATGVQTLRARRLPASECTDDADSDDR